MIEQLKTDRIAQIMLVGIVIAGLFACGTVSIFAFKFINRPAVVAPEPTATPEKTSSIDLLEFRDISVDVTDSFLEMTGLVQNNSTEVCTFVEVTVQYFDANDSLITFGKSHLEFVGLEPGQSSPFNVLVQRPPGSPEPDRFSLSLSTSTGCIPAN